MGFFGKIHKWVNSKIKKVGNFHNIADKAKKGWNMGTQILNTARKVTKTAKKVVGVLNMVPGVQEFTMPLLAGIETADVALGTVDKYKSKAEKGYKRAKAINQKVGRYSAQMDQAGSLQDKIKLGEKIINDAVSGATKYRNNPSSFFN